MKIIGLGVFGKDESQRYARHTLEEFKRLCDETIIATNFASEDDIKLIEEYGFTHYEDNREWGKKQPDIKTTLLEHGSKLNPDWIVALDMDEQFAPEVTRQTLEDLALTGEIGWNFMIVNLYNDEKHFANSTGIKRFWNIRYYKYMPELGLKFQEKRLHCGIAPPYAYRFGWHAPYYILHRGLMKAEDRQRKSERYAIYDPNARFITKDYYDDLKKELKTIIFNPNKLLKDLSEAPECQKRKVPSHEEPKTEVVKVQKQMEKAKPKEYIVRRLKDGVLIGIPEISLETTLARVKYEGNKPVKEFELVSEYKETTEDMEALFGDK